MRIILGGAVKTYSLVKTVKDRIVTPKGRELMKQVWITTDSGLSWADAKAKRRADRSLRIVLDHPVGRIEGVTA